MIRSVYSFGLILAALLGPYAIIQMFVGDYILSATVYGSFLLLALLFLGVTHVATMDV